jgi:Fur family transcriptional regulator, peroxide stress response regulator
MCIEEKLREQKIKITPQRLELIKKLKELKNTHPSFNRIYKAITEIHPNVSRSTVHENLKLLVELGVIRSFHYKGQTRYEMNLEPHVNLAEFDGTIRDIKNYEINKHLQEIVRILKEDEGIKVKSLLTLVE